MTSTMKNALLFIACICLFLLGTAEAQNTTTNWTHIRNTPTTVAGYGIGDVWTRTQADARYAPIAVPYANLATLPGGTFLTPQTLGTVSVPSACGISARSVGTSFTILCSQATDTSVIAWQIIEPAP